MANPWTPTGDKWPQPAMVWVREHGVSYSCVKNTDNNSSYSIPSHYLCPMPPAIAPEQQAVLDAAVEYVRDREDATRGGDYTKLLTAVRTMLAARQPPDPVKELREAWEEVLEHGVPVPAAQRMVAAITALEAKS